MATRETTITFSDGSATKTTATVSIEDNGVLVLKDADNNYTKYAPHAWSRIQYHREPGAAFSAF